jgi:hypothetical protein
MPVSRQADLTDYVFAGQPGFSGELLAWLESSARFTTFLDTYRDKIRKKIRSAGDGPALQDVRAELALARALLADRRLALAYEPYASAGRRAPDFAVTFRDNTRFNLEVARLRPAPGTGAEAGGERSAERIPRILLDKLGQVQPGMANLLAIHLSTPPEAIDLDGLLRAVKSRAENRDPAFYASSRYSGPPDFSKDFLLLAGVLLWSSGAGMGPARLWVNRQARPALDEKILRLVAIALSPSPPGL